MVLMRELSIDIYKKLRLTSNLTLAFDVPLSFVSPLVTLYVTFLLPTL